MRRKNNALSKLFFMALLVVFLGTLVACDQTNNEEVKIEKVELSEVGLILTIGETAELTATVLPSTVADKSVTWKSGDNKIATVDAGKVTAIAAGTTTISAIASDGKTAATCSVRVNAVATGVSLNKESFSLFIGGQESLEATLEPENVDETLVWTVDPAGIVAVDGEGLVTALAVGVATVTVTVGDSEISASVVVTVNPKVTEIITVENELELLVDDSEKIAVTIKTLPENAEVAILWESSDESIVMVNDEGLVTAVAPGEANVIIKSGDETKTIKITVLDPNLVKRLYFEEEQYAGSKNSTISVKVTPVPATADKEIVYSSSNENIATVDENGEVTILNYGKTVITASSQGETAEVVVYGKYLAENYDTDVVYNEDTGEVAGIKAIGGDLRTSVFDTDASLVYYAEITFDNISTKVPVGTTGVGLLHSLDATSITNNYIHDLFHSHAFDVGNVGYWHRVGYGNNLESKLVNFHETSGLFGTNTLRTYKESFENGAALNYAIARNGDFIYTIIDGVIFNQLLIPESYRGLGTRPGVLFNGSEVGKEMTANDYVYLTGEAAIEKLGNLDYAMRYSRSEEGYRPVVFNDKTTAGRFVNNTGIDWAASITTASIFGVGSTVQFDVDFKGVTNGHIKVNFALDEKTGYEGNVSSNTGDDSTVAGYAFWMTDNIIRGVDMFNGDGGAFNDIEDITATKLRFTAEISLVENKYVVKLIIVDRETEDILDTITINSAKEFDGTLLRVHFLSNANDYEVSNYKKIS